MGEKGEPKDWTLAMSIIRRWQKKGVSHQNMGKVRAQHHGGCKDFRKVLLRCSYDSLRTVVLRALENARRCFIESISKGQRTRKLRANPWIWQWQVGTLVVEWEARPRGKGKEQGQAKVVCVCLFCCCCFFFTFQARGKFGHVWKQKEMKVLEIGKKSKWVGLGGGDSLGQAEGPFLSKRERRAGTFTCVSFFQGRGDFEQTGRKGVCEPVPGDYGLVASGGC